jgi:S1-C subfamily serine protease
MQGFGDIAEKLRRSTVHLRAGRRGQGSGIIVSPDGLMVTNAHVATLGRIDVQFWDGVRSEADLLLSDAGRDLAILRGSRSGLPAAVLADSDRLRMGETCHRRGQPLWVHGSADNGSDSRNWSSAQARALELDTGRRPTSSR